MRYAPKSIFIAVILALSGSAVLAGPFEDAVAAADKGDHATVARLMRPLADQGDPEAQTIMGNAYVYGKGVPQDSAEGLKWLRRAADQSHAVAQYSLGLLYEQGRGVARDRIAALTWYNLSAARGDEDAVKARDTLAKKLPPGDVSQARTLANDWKPGVLPARKTPSEIALAFPRPAKSNNPAVDAAREAYAKRDYTAALEKTRPLAEQGDPDAQVLLGALYQFGQGVQLNHTDALKWYGRAADQGNAEGLFFLGAMHALGQGTPKNSVTALMLLNLSIARGNTGAANTRNLLLREMNATQIAEAEKRAAEWTPVKR